MVVEWSATSRACLVPMALPDATKFNSSHGRSCFTRVYFLTTRRTRRRVVYTLLLPLAFSQTISAHVQRFKMCNTNYQGCLRVYKTYYDSCSSGLATNCSIPMTKSLWSLLVEVIIFRVTQSLNLKMAAVGASR